MLGPFRIRNLRRPASPPNRQAPGSVPAKGVLEAVVCLTGREYQSNALNHPESRLRYLDEDDGETVTVSGPECFDKASFADDCIGWNFYRTQLSTIRARPEVR